MRNVSYRRLAVVVATVALLVACGSHATPSAPTPPVDLLPGFTLTGDPASTAGATWTYQADVAGVRYDLQGILLKPQGSGQFPAVIISHGAGGNANGYSRSIARVMVGWGLVCIATNYTHAGGGVPIGSPGASSQGGASAANVQRARKLVDVLRALGFVDTNRLALHGHSLGAFVTIATAGAHPDLFRAASHTAGGVVPDFVPDVLGVAAATISQASSIRAAYQMHHGDRDFVVPLAADQLFDTVLSGRGVPHELLVYAGAGHEDVAMNATALDRIRVWYARQGMF